MAILCSTITGPTCFQSYNIYIFGVEQTGGQRFVLHPRIAELWQLKGHKVENVDEDDCLSFF